MGTAFSQHSDHKTRSLVEVPGWHLLHLDPRESITGHFLGRHQPSAPNHQVYIQHLRTGGSSPWHACVCYRTQAGNRSTHQTDRQTPIFTHRELSPATHQVGDPLWPSPLSSPNLLGRLKSRQEIAGLELAPWAERLLGVSHRGGCGASQVCSSHRGTDSETKGRRRHGSTGGNVPPKPSSFPAHLGGQQEDFDHLPSVFPSEHSLRTRTQVRHQCTQVHDEKRSSKLAKSISVPFGADKPLICHSKKRHTRAKSRILSRRKPCTCMRLLSRHGLLADFSVKLKIFTKFSKGTTWTLNALQPLLCSPIKNAKRPVPAQKPQTWSNDEWFAVKERGPMTNVHDWCDLRYLRSPNLGIAFSSRESPEEDHVESSNWERSSWASCLGFLDRSKKRGASESKGVISKASGLVQIHIMAHTVRQQLQVF